MKWTLNRKFALILFLASLTLVGGMAIATHLSFKKGLLHYLNKTDQKRIATLTEVLAEHHQRMHGWSSMRNDPSQWHHLMRSALRFYVVPPPQHFDQHPDDTHHRELPSHPDQPPKRPKLDWLTMAPRYSLMDREGHWLAGMNPPAPDAMRYPIETGQGVVGYLLVQPLHMISDRLDKAFVRHQRSTLIYIVGSAALLALIIAYLLSQHLLTPILQLANATRALASGKYGTRIAVNSQDELGDLTQDFNRLASSLESNEQLRRHWMADISHELRTPVTVLKGEIEALQDGVRPLTPQAIQSLHQEAELLAKLIEDLYQLSLSDLGALAYQLQTLDPLPLLHGVIESYRQSFAEKGITIELENSPTPDAVTVYGDASRLQQLFQPLHQNLWVVSGSGNAPRV